jgi:hypothetical protein
MDHKFLVVFNFAKAGSNPVVLENAPYIPRQGDWVEINGVEREVIRVVFGVDEKEERLTVINVHLGAVEVLHHVEFSTRTDFIE